MRPFYPRFACVAILIPLLSACGSSPRAQLQPTATTSSAAPTTTVAPPTPAASPTLVATESAPTAPFQPTEAPDVPADADEPLPTLAPVQTATEAPPTAAIAPASTAEPPTATVAAGASGKPTPEATAAEAPPAPVAASVVYQSPSDGSIRAISLAGNSEVVLGDPSEPDQLLPWGASPDGRSIALITGRGWGPKADGPPERASLWIVNLDASAPRKLLDLLSVEQPLDLAFSGDYRALTNDFFQRLAWTPDGAELVVVSAHEGQVDLYAVPVAGGQPRRLTNTPDLEFMPVVSGDGSEVAYGTATSFGTGAGWGSPGAWAQPLSGGSPGSIIGSPPDGVEPASATTLGWTTAGSAIATTGSNVSGDLTFWVAAPGAAPRVLYSGPAGQPAWNAATDTLAFTERPEFGGAGDGNLYLWRPGDETATAAGAAPRSSSLWSSPDGRGLLLCAGTPGQGDARRVLWLEGALRELGPGECERVVWARDGSVAVVDREGNGVVAGPDGGVLRPLPAPAVLVDWLDEALILFRPAGDGRWRLSRFVGDHDEAVIADVDVEPANPALVRPD